jgi:ATP adenylyltransferase/5',5'''-P-1,P-4-tetraphosphate phosphorylase II
MSIVKLPQIVEKLPKEKKKIFRRIFDVEVEAGKLKIPLTLKDWAKKRFKKLETVRKQTIVKVINKVTFEGTFYNQLRALRIQKEDLSLPQIVEEKECMFCNPKEKTPEDIFGRIEKTYTITAANIAKYDGWHGIVILKKHNPLRLSFREVLEGFEVAYQWYNQVRQVNPKAIFPYLIWNCLWRAGASQTHSHFQVMISQKPYPRIKYLCHCAAKYKKSYNADYFQDLYSIHEALGLGLTYQNVKVLTYLTPVKEKEVLIFTNGWRRSLLKAIYRIIETYKRIGVYSFNLFLAIPPFKECKNWENFPYLVRIVDRGPLNQRVSDIGTMELYAASIVASDPFHLAKKLKMVF